MPPRTLTPERWLVIMAKAPRAGAVKTRLARDVGPVRAAAFQRATMGHLVRRLAPDPRWRTLLAVDPDPSVANSDWPPGIARFGQGGGDLGRRMQRIMKRLPPGPAVIVGTDIPALAASHVARAFRLLGRHDAVLGPADDGGYWLVGLKRTPKVLSPFGGVRWSTRHALADTRANLAGWRVAVADRLSDVDDGKSYRRLKGAGARIVLPPRLRRGV